MCPLRIILIFLSATLAGFFVLRNLKNTPVDFEEAYNNKNNVDDDDESELDASSSVPRSKKVLSAIGSGFWTCVDMASGRYLWRHLGPSPKQS
ncbi:hypothetical protein MKW94_001178 [Papaver nudicaule]|uniref:Methyltransferase-related protein n=1 Tax=Papaver nudicaule TaxID=74823 RepID=A0AA41VDK4_PAPNU|nr:hypothetical protein [Papaver nudicaule]